MWKTLRVFVSSTFLDMHAERDHLVRFVFPELRERCAARRLYVVEIDLRWGIPKEEALDGGAVSLCMDEVDHCRPYFIGILGERYGSIIARAAAGPRSETACDGDEPSITEAEIRRGAFAKDHGTDSALFYFRDPSFLVDVPAAHRARFESESPEARCRLDRLKAAIRERYEVVTYHCRYAGEDEAGEPALKELEDFGQKVLEALWSVIVRAHPEEATDDLSQVERLQQDSFIEDRRRHFVGREALLDELAAYANDRGPMPLVVHGERGCGKSALLSTFARRFEDEPAERAPILYFAGTEPNSLSVSDMLARLCDELRRRCRVRSDATEQSADLGSEFRRLLRVAGAVAPLLIIVDGIDQLIESAGVDLTWLPTSLPEGVRLLIGCAPGSWLREIQSRRPSPRSLLVGPLPDDERSLLVRTFLSQYGKRLSEAGEDQMSRLLQKQHASNPLYLRLACEELRIAFSFASLTQRLDALPDAIGSLFDTTLARLEDDHSSGFVSKVTCALACARDGLFEAEIVEAVLDDEGRRFPAARWARLRRALAPYLVGATTRTALPLKLFHGELTSAILERYASTEEERLRVHAGLAAYFRRGADPQGDASWAGSSRALRQLPFHLAHARDVVALESTLANFEFLFARLAAGPVWSLLDDFHLAEQIGVTGLRPVADALLACATTLDRDRHQLAGQLVGRLPASTAGSACRLLEGAHAWGQACWLSPAGPSVTNPGTMVASLAGHAGSVCDVAMTADGLRVISASHTDDALKVWDVARATELLSLRGHRGGAYKVAVSADGRRAVSAGLDWTLRAWDLQTGSALWTFPGHIRFSGMPILERVGQIIARGTRMSASGAPEYIHSIGISDDGGLAISANKAEIKLWDLDRGEKIVTLRADNACAAISGDGTLIASGAGWKGETIDTWRIPPEGRRLAGPITASRVRSTVGHVDAISLTRDGGCAIVSLSQIGMRDEGRAAIVALARSECGPANGNAALPLLSLCTPVFTNSINAVAITRDGLHAVTASREMDVPTLHRWSVASGECIRTVKANSSAFDKVVLSDDGSRAAAARGPSAEVWNIGGAASARSVEEGYLRSLAVSELGCCGVWTADSEARLQGFDQDSPVRVLEHGGAVWQVALTNDGSHAFTAASGDRYGIVGIRVWNCASGRAMGDHALPTTQGRYRRHAALLPLGPTDMLVVTFPSDDRLCVARHGRTDGGAWGVIDAVDLDTRGESIAVAVSEDGHRFASMSGDGTVRVADLGMPDDGLRAIGRADIANRNPSSSPRLRIAGTRVFAYYVSRDDDRALTIFDCAAGAATRGLTSHVAALVDFDVSRDMTRVVTVSNDRTCRLWDPETGRLLANFTADEDFNRCCISPEGDAIAVGSGRGAQMFRVRGDASPRSILAN